MKNISVKTTELNIRKLNLRPKLTILILVAGLILLFILSLCWGKYPLSLNEIFKIIGHVLFGTEADYAHKAEIAMIEVRLPRLLACIFVGAALSVSGATYQAVFKNPIISPDLLGASSGAAFGACCAILLAKSTLVMHLTAFAFGIMAVGLTYLISILFTRGRSSTLSLVLTGIVVSALFNAGVSITKTLADTDDKLGEITFWLMGSMTKLRSDTILILVIPVAIGLIPLILFRYRLNVLSFGDEEASAMGVNVRVMRFIFVICATLITSASVAACGTIGWIGLIGPHFVRLIIGSDYKNVIPAAAAAGALFLMVVDNISRIFFDIEVSVGIMTALIGAPLFLFLLVSRRDELQ